MDGEEIANILIRDSFVQPTFQGVFSSDHLPQLPVKQRPAAFVVNTDPSRRPGEHWIAIYLPKCGPVEYFDSYGKPPKVASIRTFLARNGGTIKMNPKTLQGPSSSVCGHYCIYYLIHRCRGQSMEAITGRFDVDQQRNDRDVYEYTTHLMTM
ncbi:hypothetical protein HOLleu_42857 [Holothuria leucospilota]|uniref:Uncharacterized protein n=1 Tax=Holothuria leucospilota TaxID=206669 RepID=A0A9Q0YCB5_HOLLE|nr:hypothetical protein HOLleu_42857 [Holothuria leucospilota]